MKSKYNKSVLIIFNILDYAIYSFLLYIVIIKKFNIYSSATVFTVMALFLYGVIMYHLKDKLKRRMISSEKE